jgi:hypothetical protein
VSYFMQTRGNRSLKVTVRALINPPGPRSCVCVRIKTLRPCTAGVVEGVIE